VSEGDMERRRGIYCGLREIYGRIEEVVIIGSYS